MSTAPEGWVVLQLDGFAVWWCKHGHGLWNRLHLNIIYGSIYGIPVINDGLMLVNLQNIARCQNMENFSDKTASLQNYCFTKSLRLQNETYYCRISVNIRNVLWDSSFV